MLVKTRLNLKEPLTAEQEEMLEKAAKMPVVYDEDSPELSDETLKKFRRVSKSEAEERRKARKAAGA